VVVRLSLAFGNIASSESLSRLQSTLRHGNGIFNPNTNLLL
jgi:hypothetical protein